MSLRSASSANEITVTLPRLTPAQQRVVSEARRYNVLACGRRFGKTTLLLDELITGKDGALDGKPVGWFAPTYKLLDEVWREARSTFTQLVKRTDAQQKRLEFITGGVLDMWSLDTPDAGRGRSYAKVAIDEAAMARHLEHAWGRAIRPTLTDLRGSAWFASTPKGFDYFKALYDLGQDPQEAAWASWKLPTSENPFISRDEIEAARLELPERAFAQEYLADFLEANGSVFRGVLDAAVLEPRPPESGRDYVMGVDWGKLNDFTVLSVLDVGSGDQVYLDRFNQIDYHFQLQRLRTAFDRYKPKAIVAESNSMGEPLIEQLRRQAMPVRPFVTNNASKSAAIENLSLRLERGEVTLLNDPVQTAELQAYQAERLPSGLMRYGAPLGMHDDTVMALALAVEMLRKPTRVTII